MTHKEEIARYFLVCIRIGAEATAEDVRKAMEESAKEFAKAELPKLSNENAILFKKSFECQDNSNVITHQLVVADTYINDVIPD